MLGNFTCFFKINSFGKFFQEYLQSVIYFGSRSGSKPNAKPKAQHFVGPDLGPNCLETSSSDSTSWLS